MKKIVTWVKSKITSPAIQSRKCLLTDELSRMEDWAMQFLHMSEGQLGTDRELAELFGEMSEAVFEYRAQALALWRHEENSEVPTIDNVAVMRGATCPANASPAKKVAMFFTWAKGTRQLAVSFNECDERNMRKALLDIANGYVKLGLAFASRLGVHLNAAPLEEIRDDELVGVLA